MSAYGLNLQEIEREAFEHEQKARALRAIALGVRALNGEPVDLDGIVKYGGAAYVIGEPQRSGIRGPRAVLEVMNEEPDRLWKNIDIKRIVLARGLAPSPKAVEASLKRAKVRGLVVSPQYGYYCLPDADCLPQRAAVSSTDERAAS